ncbi:MAG TPA: LssY C-terminal domain-containing protein [Acidobacteriaceae bacterium]|nr:LssY C-terminal domain-containing protein [Acidobacteriaceae bacterium]
MTAWSTAQKTMLTIACIFTWMVFVDACQLHAQASQQPAQVQTGTHNVPALASVAMGVQPIPLEPSSLAKEKPSKSQSLTATVDGGNWKDTGMVVETGDKLTFQGSGSMTLSDGHTVQPDGIARGWTDLLRQYPLNSANSGSLIGKIGSSTAAIAFLIGTKSTLTVPTAGHLFLRVNLSSDISGDGTYKVHIQLQAEKQSANVVPVPSIAVASLLTPELFNSVPRRVRDQLGNPGDMVNFSVVGTKQQVTDAFSKAGWDTVDANTTDAIIHGLLETLSHQAYTQMPMSTLYLFGRPQDFAYARANPIEVAATRNHLRIWKTTLIVNSLPLWVGAATHDHGFEKDQRNGNVTHRIDPEVDQERQFVFSTLNDAGMVKSAAYVTPVNPVRTAKTATGGSFQSDGRIVVMLLR